MRFASLVSRCALAVVLASALFFAGCGGEPVREDRSITFSSDGSNVAFQHGESGVFVTGEDGEAEKIFQPNSDALATSPPLWAPNDKRLIFTVAKPGGSTTIRTGQGWDLTPEGRTFVKQDVQYECWLREAPKPGAANTAADPAPKLLFTARCNHPGYIAANLAVRWHPDGERIIYINEPAAGRVSLFEYTIADGKRQRIMSESADALIFGTSPEGTFLHCLAADSAGTVKTKSVTLRVRELVTGTWLADSYNVGPVLGYDPSAGVSVLREFQRSFGNLFLGGSLRSSWLERLRATEPVWSQDESQFAFLNFVPDSVDELGDPVPVEVTLDEAGEANDWELPKLSRTYAGVRSIVTVDTATWAATTAYESRRPLRDMHWSHEDQQLAFLEGDAFADLKVMDSKSADAEISTAVGSVRDLVGWNSAGDQLAYVIPEFVAKDPSQRWTFLLVPVGAPRDRVMLLPPQAGQAAPREVLRGLRITFPRWSPTENKLSLWGTYSPTHHSWLTPLLPFFGLPPGDPAAVFDAETGEVSWMAINGVEEAQVAHHFLLLGEHETAWDWYKKSNANLPKPAPMTIGDRLESVSQRMGLSNTLFFQSHCLHKLGRREQAAEKLREFRRTFAMDPNSSTGRLEFVLGDRETREQLNLPQVVVQLNRIMQDQYIAEAYLSLDAAQDGITFFRREIQQADAQVTKLSAALCLSQMLLAAGEHDAYVDLAFDEIVPQLALLIEDHELEFGGTTDAPNISVQTLGTHGVATALVAGSALALIPLVSRDFLETVSPETLRPRVEECEAIIAQSKAELIAPIELSPTDRPHDPRVSLVEPINEFLFAAYHRLGDEERCLVVSKRIEGEVTAEELAVGYRQDARRFVRFLQELEW